MCKPDASMSAPPPPPREDKRPSTSETQYTVQFTPCTHDLIIFPLPPPPSHLELTENPCNVMYAQKSNCTCLISFEMSQCAW